VQGVHRRVEPLEVLPAVLAAVDAVIGSGQNAAGLFWVDCEAEHAAFGPQSGTHLPPAFTAVRADPGAVSYGVPAQIVKLSGMAVSSRNPLIWFSFPKAYAISTTPIPPRS
jgi:hypothetical protein